MAKRTKKVRSVGRFQARYGVRARSRVRNIETHQRAKHQCPSCGHIKVRRTETSIWQCQKCGAKFAGGAYTFRTEAGQTVERALRGGVDTEEKTMPEETEAV
jgi:large subunit ribosomal protein L37Ae